MQILRISLSISTLGLVLAGLLSLAAQQQNPKRQSNPFTSSEDVVAGSRIYRSHCASCHGLDGSGGGGGHGGQGADLTGQLRYGASDEELYSVLETGIPGTEMVATFFDGKQLWQLVSFVRTLAKAAQPGTLVGNAERGALLFAKKGGCVQCHMIGGKGGRKAPPLGGIGSSRSSKSLKNSILRPAEQVLPSHWTVQILTNRGEKVSGQRLNEDTFSIQVLDSKGRLRSLMKKDLVSYNINKKSAMPSYEGILSDEEIDDIVAYLSSLRRKRL
ncbi:MAG: hypothetical protein CMN58_03275 [Solibacterales bacterium]|nr:hypothetical protein [Bryobacterales bacterium]